MATSALIGVPLALASLKNAEARALGAVAEGFRDAGPKCVQIVRSKLGSAPAPNVETGEHFRAWRADYDLAPPKTIAMQIANDEPQALRLEKGWSGPDSLGRVYFQPARPHLGPSIPEFVETLESSINTKLRAEF